MLKVSNFIFATFFFFFETLFIFFCIVCILNISIFGTLYRYLFFVLNYLYELILMSSVPLFFFFDILLNFSVCVLLDFNDGSKRKIKIIINKIYKNNKDSGFFLKRSTQVFCYLSLIKIDLVENIEQSLFLVHHLNPLSASAMNKVHFLRIS
jgi:hypothetical protein